MSKLYDRPTRAARPRRASHKNPKRHPTIKNAVHQPDRRVDSANLLSTIRQLIELRGEFAAIVGEIASFHVVVDANIIISDLLWLTTKRKKQNVKPALLECLVSGTLVAHITPLVAHEVETTMAKLAAERGFSDEAWLIHWRDYLPHLIIIEPDPTTTAKFATGRDQTDAPTLALAETLGIQGILSADLDIKAMGGKVFPITFKLEARNYSRSTAIHASLQIGRFYLAIGAVAGVVQIFKLLILAGRSISALPTWAKLLLLAVGVGAAIHPTTRQAVQKGINTTSSAAFDAGSILLELLQKLHEEIEKNRVRPPIVSHT